MTQPIKSIKVKEWEGIPFGGFGSTLCWDESAGCSGTSSVRKMVPWNLSRWFFSNHWNEHLFCFLLIPIPPAASTLDAVVEIVGASSFAPLPSLTIHHLFSMNILSIRTHNSLISAISYNRMRLKGFRFKSMPWDITRWLIKQPATHIWKGCTSIQSHVMIHPAMYWMYSWLLVLFMLVLCWTYDLYHLYKCL